jgi:hypothetical protein
MIAPVNVPPSQLQIIQSPALDKLASSAPDITATPSLKRKKQPGLKVAQTYITLNKAVLVAQSQNNNLLENSPGDLQNNLPEATQFPKARILPSPLVSPKELPKSEQQKLESQPFSLDEQKPSKPEQITPEAQPPLLPEVKQDDKQQQPSPPLPSEVLPAPSQQSNPLPSGPPPVEPGNYPDSANYYNQNYIAPAVSFGRDTLVGATSRFGIGRNISVRPSLFLGNTARIAVPVTYDFGFNDNEQFEKNPLVVFHAGAGLDYSSRSGSNTSSLNPLVVFGADLYLGDGAAVLLQLGNTFNSDFVAVAGVGLQF